MKLKQTRFYLIPLLLLAGSVSAVCSTNGPAKVALSETHGDWQFLVEGEPFFVKGVGGQSHLELARDCGANAIRTWGHDSPQHALATLDCAHSNGLMVALGFWVRHERHGFDYNSAVAGDPGRCLGGFAFLWGVKQERTGTWFSLFDPQGRQTQAVNVLREKWTGESADNQAPEIKELSLNRKTARESVSLSPGEKMEARIKARDPDRDDIRYQWLLMRESRATASGGDHEKPPEEIPVGIENQDEDRVQFTLDEPGNYCLYCYLYDGQNHVSTANIPFQIWDR